MKNPKNNLIIAKFFLGTIELKFSWLL